MTATRHVPLRLAGAVAVVFMVAVGAVLYHSRERWHRLPSGREVRLETVAYVATLRTSRGGLRLDDLRDWLGSTLSRVLGPYPSSHERGFGGPTFVIAFESRGGGGDPALKDPRWEIDLPGGQTLRGHHDGASGTSEKVDEVVTFPIAPFSERRLKLRLETEGTTLHFDVRNPAFVPKPPAWKAEPLPQTHTVEGVEITLDRVVAEWTDNWWVGSPWGADAFFSVGIGGKGAGEWFYCFHTFYDGFGNNSDFGVLSSVLFNAPVWKVRCRAVRNERFPYADSDVRWLGRIALPGPGETKVLNFGPTTRGAKLNLLALLGPGHYEVAAGKITPAPVPTDPVDPIRSYSNPEAAEGADTFNIAAENVEVLSIGYAGSGDRAGVSLAVFARDDAGHAVRLKPTHRLGEACLADLPLAAGTSDIEIGVVEENELYTEFYIPPPRPPERPLQREIP